jgi:ketosteroid isomerase-like protein
MNKKKAGIVFIALLTCVLAGQALAQGSGIEFKSNADDLTKIRSVLEEFRQDIIHKDAYALTKLMLNPNILFHSIDNQEAVDSARKYDAQFDGIGPSDLDETAKFLSTSKDKLEEKFHNIEIRQDGDLGLVTFNYDFVVNDKVANSARRKAAW